MKLSNSLRLFLFSVASIAIQETYAKDDVPAHDAFQNAAPDVPAHVMGSGNSLKLKDTEARMVPSNLRGLKRNCLVLEDYPQWKAEEGYWLGEYSFYGADGAPFESPPYRYDAYRGFITGNVEGNKYRQRNVFLYPPLTEEASGNSLVFSADQEATGNCNIVDRGDVEGQLLGGIITTTTELVGDDNALLYQVFVEFPGLPKAIIQSQLTTITNSGGTTIRTRTAQSFSNGIATNASFFRERKVSKEEFYETLQSTIESYRVSADTLCLLDGFTRAPIPGYEPGFEQCESHLETSFETL